jgi:ABC-type transport system involved in multi-copper enzyme maturation permease subunit
MIWLTWRQFRVQALVLLVPLAVLAVALIWTEPGLAHLYAEKGLNRCAVPGDCGQRTTAFLAALQSSKYPLGYFLGGAALYLFPAVIGAFWGAPLISRELEAGTFRLAWNQSVTRTRWTLVKLALIALTAMAIAGLASALVSWWAAPVDAAGGFPVGHTQLGRLSPQVFAARGLVPIGFAALTFTIGVLAGVLARKIIPAMAVTLVVFAGLLYALPAFVLPHLATPVTQVAAVTPDLTRDQVLTSGQIVVADTSLPGAWIISNQTITPSGLVFTLPQSSDSAFASACGNPTQATCTAWFASQHLRRRISYQPASRFWQLQAEETGILLVISLILAGAATWRTRRYHP